MRYSTILFTLGFLAGTTSGDVLRAQDSSKAVEFFEKEIRPLLVDKCQSCHGEKKKEGGLLLTGRRVSMRAPVIQPSNADWVSRLGPNCERASSAPSTTSLKGGGTDPRSGTGAAGACASARLIL